MHLRQSLYSLTMFIEKIKKKLQTYIVLRQAEVKTRKRTGFSLKIQITPIFSE